MSDTIQERALPVVSPSPTDLVRLVRGNQSASGYASQLPTPAGAQRQIDNLVAGQTTSTLYRSTWASLSGVAGAFAGQGAQVVNDGGSHLDPVSGVSVSNAGTYTWTGAAWQWLRGDTMADKSDWANVDQQLELNAWTLNATGSGIITFKGTYPVSGGVMALVFTAGSMGLRDKRGSGVTNFYTMTLASETTIQLGSGQVLVWNLDPEVNAFQVLTNGSARPAKYALIAYVRSGQIVAGLLMDVIARQADDMREYQLVLSPWYTDGIISSGAAPISVNLATSALFLVAGTGKQVQTLPAGTYPMPFSVPANSVLLWDLVRNVVGVYSNGADKPIPHILLTNCRTGGYGTVGALVDTRNSYEVITGRANYNTLNSRTITKYSHITFSREGGSSPAITAEGATVHASNLTLFAVGWDGTAVKQLNGAGAVTADWTFADNEVLIWNWDTNAVQKIGNNAARPAQFVTLLMRKNGVFVAGEMLPLVQDALRPADARYSHITFSRSPGATSGITVSGANVTATNLTMYAVGWDATNVKRIDASTTGAINATWAFADNEVLIWNWDSNTVQKIGNNDPRPGQFVTLLMRKNGVWVAGEMLPLVQDALIPQNALGDSPLEITESRAITFTGKFAAQGMTIVKDKIWVFDGSADDHSASAAIIRYHADLEGGFPGGGNLTHNFGHAPGADYNPKNDVMCIGNGEGTNTVRPRIDLLLNASSYNALNDVLLDWNDPVGTPRVSIDFFVSDGAGGYSKEIGGAGSVVCWGEDERTIYMLVGAKDSWPLRFFKVILGMGANDFSDATGTDLARWGTFVAGKADTEYNGTALIKQVYVGKYYGVAQGLCYHDGKLLYSVTGTSFTQEVMELTLHENGTFRCGKKYRYAPIKADGSNNAVESEDCCIFAGRYLLASGRTSSPWQQYWSLFPLCNEMGGKGTVGEPITFPFPCNQVPQPLITAVGPTADLYIEALDREGFTVASAADASGEFHWSARIA